MYLCFNCQFVPTYRYRAGGEMLIRPDGKKELNITDNNGSVRLVIIENSTGFDTLHYDYKPFGDTLIKFIIDN